MSRSLWGEKSDESIFSGRNCVLRRRKSCLKPLDGVWVSPLQQLKRMRPPSPPPEVAAALPSYWSYYVEKGRIDGRGEICWTEMWRALVEVSGEWHGTRSGFGKQGSLVRQRGGLDSEKTTAGNEEGEERMDSRAFLELLGT